MADDIDKAVEEARAAALNDAKREAAAIAGGVSGAGAILGGPMGRVLGATAVPVLGGGVVAGEQIFNRNNAAADARARDEAAGRFEYAPDPTMLPVRPAPVFAPPPLPAPPPPTVGFVGPRQPAPTGAIDQVLPKPALPQPKPKAAPVKQKGGKPSKEELMRNRERLKAKTAEPVAMPRMGRFSPAQQERQEAATVFDFASGGPAQEFNQRMQQYDDDYRQTQDNVLAALLRQYGM